MLPCGSHPGPSPPPDRAAGMETALRSDWEVLKLAEPLRPLAALRCPKVPPTPSPLALSALLRACEASVPPLALCCLQQWVKRLVYPSAGPQGSRG